MESTEVRVRERLRVALTNVAIWNSVAEELTGILGEAMPPIERPAPIPPGQAVSVTGPISRRPMTLKVSEMQVTRPAPTPPPGRSGLDPDAPYGRKKDGTPRRRPGPKPATEPQGKPVEAQVTQVVGEKQPDPLIIRAEATTKAAQPVPVERRETLTPPPRARDTVADVQEVMTLHAQPMNVDQILSALQARGWVPSSLGADPLGRLRYYLGTHRDIFHRVPGQRGVYSLTPQDEVSAPEEEEAPGSEDLDALLADESGEATDEDENEVNRIMAEEFLDLSGTNPFV